MFDLTTEMRDELRQEIIDLLVDYDYDPTADGVDEIIDTWQSNKNTLLEMFSKHPNYNGKFQIVLTEDYHRKIDASKIRDFGWWAWGIMTRKDDSSARQVSFWDNMYWKWKELCGGQMATAEFAEYVNSCFVSEQNKHNVAATGQKVSRIIGKICRMTGLDKEPDYNAHYVPFADACNPLKVTRYTILSLHPVDYYTMSFGNNWASCHTIDKTNRRGMPNSYEGMYSSGTESYMLDSSSFVVYTIDRDYVGNMWELQPKISRQMFHLGGNHDNPTCGTTMIQGRLYPQDNDSGAAELYNETRAIVQRSVAECLATENLWKNKKGTSACRDVSSSTGTHYRDYLSFDNCNVSYLMVDGKYDEENAHVEIGHFPICPHCGSVHHRDDTIECEDCYDEGIICAECGGRVDMDWDGICIDGTYFCCSSCAEHYGYRYVEDRDDWYDSDECFYDGYDEQYHLYRDGYEEMHDGSCFAEAWHAEQMGYRYVDGGRYSGEWYRGGLTRYCERCDCTVYYRDWDNDMEMCNDCAKHKREENGEETVEETAETVEETAETDSDSQVFHIGDKVMLRVPREDEMSSFAGGWNFSMREYALNHTYVYITAKWDYGEHGYEISASKDNYWRDWIWDARFMCKVG